MTGVPATRHRPWRILDHLALAVLVAAGASIAAAKPAAALSRIEGPADPGGSVGEGARGPAGRAPLPLPEAEPAPPLPVEPSDDAPAGNAGTTGNVDVLYDIAALPQPVQRMRQLIIEAALSGDLEALRSLIGIGPTRTQLSMSGIDGDPIAYLRDASGDEDGQEIMAILLDILDAGFVRLDLGGGDTYVWPYFFAVPLGELTPKQRVELFRVITAGDYADMRAYGGYNFYRTGISVDGEWRFFVAGD